ncbi:MAG: EAL domain-containing protein [Hyphomicrobiaceae bacterium]|nr:MAG: EAL domain-containing protein [Hyphomicrobiaceae bacterium]
MVPFHNTSLRTRLSLMLGTVAALVVMVGVSGIAELHSVTGITKEIRGTWLPRLEHLGEMKRAIAEHRLLAMGRTRTTNFRHLAAIAKSTEATLQSLRSAERAYQRGTVSPKEQMLLLEFLALWQGYEETLRAVLQQLEVGNLVSGMQQFDATSLPAFDAAAGKLDQLIALVNETSRAAETRALEMESLAQRVLLAVIVFAAIYVCAVVMWATRNVSAPILRISEAMHRLTAGDLSAAIADTRERNDEIGTLIGAVTGYRASLIRGRGLAEQAELERERLQAAVSNMPIGLCMYDSKRQLIICNSRYADIYQLPPELTKPGTSLRQIINDRVVQGIFSNPEWYVRERLAVVEDGRPSRDLVELADGRTLSIIHQPMAGGGWVATHEDVTERIRAEARIRHMARHDALTDLPNRSLLKEKIEEALKRTSRGEQVAVLCLDLDHFKNVNDTLGHPIGDALLCSVADRLKESVRDLDTAARFGGDEFAIVQSGVEQPTASTVLALRLIGAMSAPFEVKGHQIVIGTSIGIAVAPMDGDNADQLLKSADLALYRAKSDGRGNYRFFEPEMDARMQARHALELDLRRALPQGEFEVHYQPVVNLRTNKPSGFEALLRWHHPQKGTISPAEFIPMAEEIGMIVPLGDWVLRQACMDAAAWPDDIKVAVNLSPIQFKGQNVLTSVVNALAMSRLPPSRLELEITESVLLADNEATLAKLHQLRDLGVRVVMDDFGTGYSSLSYLRSFPFDKIKIDKSFIRNIPEGGSSLAIVRAVTGLATGLGLATTAEGVETKEQLDCIRAEGCTEVQGFIFSAPKPARELAPLLASLRGEVEVAA